jgi:hypothetical protein
MQGHNRGPRAGKERSAPVNLASYPHCLRFDAGVNSAPDLGKQRCGDHEDRGDSNNYRKLAEHLIATCPVPFQQPS